MAHLDGLVPSPKPGPSPRGATARGPLSSRLHSPRVTRRLLAAPLIGLSMLLMAALVSPTVATAQPGTKAITPAPVPVPPKYAVPAGTIFNNIKGSKAAKYRIITHLNRAIDNAPKGSTIRMAMYLFNVKSTADKLIAAHKRGVNVQILIDDGEKRKDLRRLRSALGTNRYARSYVRKCSHSCMSSRRSVMHAKFYLFSRSGRSDWVSMIASANPYLGNTVNSWNDVHTIVGDRVIYNSLNKYFNDMLPDKDNHNYFRTTTSGIYKLYLFPAPQHVGSEAAVLLDVLNHVKCANTPKGYGNKYHRTIVRVGMWGWTSSRIDVANRLRVLQSAGCQVEVILNKGRTTTPIFRALLKRTKRGQIKVYDAWYDRNLNNRAERYIHLKVVAINGWWYGQPRKVVYTGSQNFTLDGQLANNDTLLRIDSAKAYYEYATDLVYIRKHGVKGRIRYVPKPLYDTISPNRVATAGVGPDGGPISPSGEPLGNPESLDPEMPEEWRLDR